MQAREDWSTTGRGRRLDPVGSRDAHAVTNGGGGGGASGRGWRKVLLLKRKGRKIGLKLNEWEEGKERGWQNAREELRRTKLERDDEGMQ